MSQLNWKNLSSDEALKLCQSKKAQQLGVKVRSGGSHFVATCTQKQSSTAIPYNMKSTGVKHSVWKWLVSIGLVSIAAIIAIVADLAKSL